MAQVLTGTVCKSSPILKKNNNSDSRDCAKFLSPRAHERLSMKEFSYPLICWDALKMGASIYI